MKRPHAGFSLIEVLVALLLLALGALGSAALQANALRLNHSAASQSIAVQLASDMAERIRANRQAALNGDYNLTAGASPSGGSTLAAGDLADWYAQVTSMLPDGRAAIETDAASETITITLTWSGERVQSGLTESYQVVVAP